TASNWAAVNTFASQSGTVYFSFALTWTNQEQDDFLYFALSNDADLSPVALGNSAGVVINGFTGAAGRVGGRIRNDSTGNTTQTTSGFSGGGTNTSTTQFYVGSLSKVSSTNYNTLKLWLNPTTTTEGPHTHTITQDMGIASGLDTFYFFTGAGNESNEVIKLDSIRIGLTYSDVTAANPDSDNDGMTDTWEITYFGNTGQAAADDFDKDGTDNLTEFRLGLIPNSGSSRFAASWSSGGVISWPSVTGVTFKVWRSTTLQTGSWSDRGNVPGTAGTASFTDPSPPAGTAFYRIALLP
ncbi:MAG: hypothetical protein H7X97_03635, partial [Opitutaceae bacterium]|nr:hypothetical protein [Verrucomicrobiales bacterium]